MDTDRIGFRDDIFYDYLAGKEDLLSMEEHQRQECLKLFDEYEKDERNQRY